MGIPVGKIVGIGIGAFVAQDVGRYLWGARGIQQGGNDDGTITGQIRSKYHAGTTAVAIGMTNPRGLLAANAVQRHSLEMEEKLWLPTNVSTADGIVDAFRHTYWQALTVVEVAEKGGNSIDQASGVARRIGDAHERDSQLPAGRHRQMSMKMDLYNNVIGRRIGVELLQRKEQGIAVDTSRDGVAQLVLKSLREGEAVYLDNEYDMLPTSSEVVDNALRRSA